MCRLFASLAALAIIGAGSSALFAQPASPPPGDPPPLSVTAGTRAPDGIGVTTAPSTSADKLAYGNWVDISVVRPLQPGAKIPPACIVQTVEGKPFSLNAAVASRPTVLIFYRGGWCPYCNAHLRQLQGSMQALQAMGYQLLAISSDTPKELRDTLTKDKLSYQLLSDSKIEVAAKFGLRYKANDEFLNRLKNGEGSGYGPDLTAQNGGYLLTPGAFILDRTGVIRFVYANNNFTVRISQEALLKAARDALHTPNRTLLPPSP